MSLAKAAVDVLFNDKLAEFVVVRRRFFNRPHRPYRGAARRHWWRWGWCFWSSCSSCNVTREPHLPTYNYNNNRRRRNDDRTKSKHSYRCKNEIKFGITTGFVQSDRQILKYRPQKTTKSNLLMPPQATHAQHSLRRENYVRPGVCPVPTLTRAVRQVHSYGNRRRRASPFSCKNGLVRRAGKSIIQMLLRGIKWSAFSVHWQGSWLLDVRCVDDDDDDDEIMLRYDM